MGLILFLLFSGIAVAALVSSVGPTKVSEKKLMVTIEEYIAQGGHVCPFCGSKDIFGRFTRSFDTSNKCGECNMKWTDIYDDTLTAKNKLAGISFTR